MTDVQWYLALLLFLLVIGGEFEGPGSRARNAWCATIVFIAALSAPEAVYLLPLAVWRIAKAKDAATRLIPSALLAAVAIQGVILATHHTSWLSPLTGFDGLFFGTAVAYVHRVIITSVAGQWASEAIAASGAQGEVLGVLIILVMLATLAIEHSRRVRLRLALLLASSVILVALLVGERGWSAGVPNLGSMTYGGERHFFLSIVTFVLAVAIALENIPRLSSRLTACIFTALFISGAIASHHVPPLIETHWSTYAPSVDRWIRLQRDGDKPRGPLTIPENPQGWFFSLPPHS